MYQLFIGDDLIYQPGIEELCLIDIKITLELNKAGTLDFTVPPTHPYYDKLPKLVTYIDLYDDGEFIWRFRVLNTDDDFYKQRTVSCEGELSFLFDSIQRPYEHKGSISTFLKMLIDNHNAQVEKDKQFEMGLCNVVDGNNYINRSNGYISKTLDAINDKLIETHGGYIRVRTEQGHRYLDYISDYGHECSQVIRFGENMLDLSNYINGENVRTAIIPQGAELEEDGINGVKKRLDITSVNGGKDYVYSESAVKLFGWIWDTVQFDDVTLASNLKKKAEAYLEECINLQMSLELTAVDLHLINVDTEKIKLGDWVTVISEPHGLNRKFLVSKLVMDIESPENNKITLGSIIPTFTSNTSKSNKEISARVDAVAGSTNKYIESAVDNATKLITGGLGGYVVIAQAEDGHPESILILDTPNKDTAKNVIQLNKNGLGFSNTGINGPYRNAWTIDGNLVADFITTGVLRGLKIICGDNFSVDENGNMDAKNAKFQGDITGGSITGKTTINVGTDLHVGNNIYLGNQDTDDYKEIYLNKDTYIQFSNFAVVIQRANSQFFMADKTFFVRLKDDFIPFLANLDGKKVLLTGEEVSIGGDLSVHSLTVTDDKPAIFQGGFQSWEFAVFQKGFQSWEDVLFAKNVSVSGDLSVYGNKNRIVKTENYGNRKLNAVESAECYFTDEGQIVLNGNGTAEIYFDPIWLETVNIEHPYHIQLTSYCEVNPWIVEEHSNYCVIAGKPHAKVNWHISALQKGYENTRLEEYAEGGIQSGKHS